MIDALAQHPQWRALLALDRVGVVTAGQNTLLLPACLRFDRPGAGA